MSSTRSHDIESLRQLCREKKAETLRLEFKTCSELKVGTTFHDRKRNERRARQTDDVLNELTKDVTAFLNAAGGTLVYGILEDGKSRAKKLDEENPFRSDSKQNNIRPERVIDWLRDHVQPSPAVDVYAVFESNDEGSPWYLVIETPQGQQAFQAKDRRFYKRVGNTVKPMEQYEVADVMNRTRAAALELRVEKGSESEVGPIDNLWQRIQLGIAVTSTNFVASEYGALKLTMAYPLRFIRNFHPGVRTAELTIGGELPRAEAIMYRWGIQKDSVVFPGDWFDFHGTGFHIQMPRSDLVPNPTYLFQAEVFTVNSQSKEALFAIQQPPLVAGFDLISVDASNREGLIQSYWATCHRVVEELKAGQRG